MNDRLYSSSDRFEYPPGLRYLQRYSDPDPQHDLGLWVLLHPDLKRTARVLAFRDYLIKNIEEQRELFEGRLPRV
ncbi:MAG: hypothetical protein R6V21_05120 [Pelovirga sp.]